MTQLAGLDKPQSSFFEMVINGLMFNISWFVIIVSQSTPLAVAIVIVHLLVHFAVMGRGRREVRLIAVLAVFGAALDQLLFWVGVFTIDEQATMAPLWLSCLWPVVATTFMHAFEKLQGRVFMAATLGAIGGAASYAAGTGLSDVAFTSDLYGPVIMGLIWAIIFPGALSMAAALQRGQVTYECR